MRRVIVAGIVLFSGAVFGRPPVDPRLADWVFLQDVPPFVHSTLSQPFRAGGAGYYGASFYEDSDEGNVSAGTSYNDESRNMGVSVKIRHQAQGLYVDHFVEKRFRNRYREGRFSPNMQMLQLPEGVVYFFCENSPNCIERTYRWLSGINTGVLVRTNCGVWQTNQHGQRKLVRQPCPEPTEILQAYLTRYPSSLSYYVDDDSQALRWWKREAEFEMAVAKYNLVRARPNDTQVARRLEHFARIRGHYLDGPAAGPQESRIAAMKKLPAEIRHELLSSLWDEYHAWWVAKYATPVALYVSPTPTPAPPTPPPTP